MTHSGSESDLSDLSEALTTLTTPFSIAARTVASAKHTRNIENRRPIVPRVPKKKRPAPAIPRGSDDHAPLIAIPTAPTESPDNEPETSLSSEDATQEISTLQIPGPGSSVSQATGSFFKRP